MVTVLIPELRDAFDVSSSAASLALTAYLVPFAALQLVSGTLGERLGPRAGDAGRVHRVRLGLAVGGGGGRVRAVPGRPRAPGRGERVHDAAGPGGAGRRDAGGRDSGSTMGTFAAVQTAGVVGAPLVGGLAGALDYRLAFVAAAVAALSWRGCRRRRRRGARRARAAGASARASSRRSRRGRAGPPPPRSSPTSAITGLGVVVSLRAGRRVRPRPDRARAAAGRLRRGGRRRGTPGGRPDRPARRGARRRRRRVRRAWSWCRCSASSAARRGSRWCGWPPASPRALLWAGLNVLTVGAAPANRGGAVSLIGAFKFAGNALAPVSWLALYDAATELAFAGAGGVCVRARGGRDARGRRRSAARVAGRRDRREVGRVGRGGPRSRWCSARRRRGRTRALRAARRGP